MFNSPRRGKKFYDTAFYLDEVIKSLYADVFNIRKIKIRKKIKISSAERSLIFISHLVIMITKKIN